MRATDERKGKREREGQTVGTESEQAVSWSSDNRAGSVTRLPQTHRKSSFPVGLRMHKVAQGTSGLWTDQLVSLSSAGRHRVGV